MDFADEARLSRRANHPAMPSFVYSCVVDPSPKFGAQLRIWVTTLTECAGVSASDLFVHIVRRDSDSAGLEQYLERRGIAFTYTTPFGDGRMGNRLEQLRTPALLEREYAVLCDTDLAFVSRAALPRPGRRRGRAAAGRRRRHRPPDRTRDEVIMRMPKADRSVRQVV